MKTRMMALCAIMAAMGGVAQADVMLSAWNKVVTPGTWDLREGDVLATLRLDFTNIPEGWYVFQFGLAAQNQSNYDTGVWLQVRPHGSADTSSGGYDVFDMHEHILLQRRQDPTESWPTTDEPVYDAVNPNDPTITGPFGGNNNTGFYFDRGSVTDPVQQGLFGWADGGNYNTEGIYDIELLFTKVNATEGAVFATVNGVRQGFYSGTPNYADEPDYYPAGLSFSTDDLGGSFSNLEVWYGQASAPNGGYSVVSNVTIIPEPTSLLLLALGGVCLMLRRRRR